MEKILKGKKFFAFTKGLACFTGILLVMFAVFSCNNVLIRDGGSLIIALPGARAASASSFTIELTGANGFTKSKPISSGTTVQFDDLAPGTYNIVVEGMDTNNKVVLGGSTSATVVAGETASAKVNLAEGVSDFAGFEEAVAAGGTVNVLTSIDVEKTLSISNTVTIVPVYQDVTLKNIGSGNLFSVADSAGNLTIGGGEYTITLDGNQVTQSIIKMTAGTATLTDNGIITNAAASAVNISFSGSSSGTFEMTGGTIMNNTSSSGGAVSLQGARFTMSGGILKDNKSSGTGGAIAMLSGTCTITGGSITGNTAQNYGGGVQVSGGTFVLSGGSISNNSASNGSGVYMSAGSFQMRGSATVDLSNDVYLNSGRQITITGEITAEVETVATITPYTEGYAEAAQVLSAGGDVTLTEDIVSKFVVTPKTDDGSQWTIDTSGNLQQVGAQ